MHSHRRLRAGSKGGLFQGSFEDWRNRRKPWWENPELLAVCDYDGVWHPQEVAVWGVVLVLPCQYGWTLLMLVVWSSIGSRVDSESRVYVHLCFYRRKLRPSDLVTDLSSELGPSWTPVLLCHVHAVPKGTSITKWNSSGSRGRVTVLHLSWVCSTCECKSGWYAHALHPAWEAWGRQHTWPWAVSCSAWTGMVASGWRGAALQTVACLP